MKSPYLNRHLIKKLQQLGAERNPAKAKALFEALPATPKAVVALCCYVGKLGGGVKWADRDFRRSDCPCCQSDDEELDKNDRWRLGL